MAPAKADEGHAKGLAALAQALDAGIELLRGFRREPGAEAEHPACDGRVRHQRQVAFNIRLAAGRGPGDGDLRFDGQEDIGSIELVAKTRALLDESGLALGPALAAGQVQKRCNC